MSTPLQDPRQDIATFMASALGELSDIEAASAVVVGVPFDDHLGRRGAVGDAAQAIREASLAVLAGYIASPSRTVVDLETGRTIRLKSPPACLDLGDLVLEQAHASDVCDTVRVVAQRIIDRDALPVFIGGSRAVFSALPAAHTLDDDAAVLLVSHDLRLSGAAGGCPTVALGVNGLQDESRWHAVAGTGAIICADEVHDGGIDAAAAALNASLAGHGAVYCCIDMAVLDTGHAAGTPDVNVGGLTPEQLVGVLAGIDCLARLRGLVVCNVAPRLDLRAQTEFTAAQALATVLAPYLFDEIE